MPENVIDLPGEIWKPIPKYGGKYWVSTAGRLWARSKHGLEQGRLLPLSRKGTKRCYHLGYTAWWHGNHEVIFVHRAMLEAFVGPCPEGMECCHNNGNGLDNRLENLRWDTREENIADMKFHARQKKLGIPLTARKDMFS